jgi:hypothetical protein
VLLSSGYIAGGAIVGVLAAFLNFKDEWVTALNLAPTVDRLLGEGASESRWTIMTAFGVMLALLVVVGLASRLKNDRRSSSNS